MSALAVLLLLILVGAEIFLIQHLQATIGSSISQSSALILLESLVAFEAALIGFSAIVYSSFLSRDMSLKLLLNLIAWMGATMILFFVAVISTFYDFAGITPQTGLDSSLLSLPLGFLHFFRRSRDSNTY